MPTVNSVNPFNGNRLKSYTTHTENDVAEIIGNAAERFAQWRTLSHNDRSNYIRAVGKELLARKDYYAHMITQEMGKPISQSIAEIEKCAWLCDYYIETGENHLKDEAIVTDAHESFVSYEPLGVILAVMPWNYPFWQVFRFAIPALLAGNIALLKHASNVFGSALAIEEVFDRAGLPSYCFKTLLIKSDMVKMVIEDERVKAVTLTGSGPAGAAVASSAAKKIKKSVLELGGNNALIVMDDCNLEQTIEKCIQARFQNTGQSCIAGKRLLVHETIADEFIQKLVSKVKELKSGNPEKESTFIGTLAREDLAEELEEQVNRSLEMEAQLELGGKRCDAYFEPTILTKVTPEMPIFKEETFGPVLGVMTFRDIDEAIALSNNSRFGLGVSLFTSNTEKAKEWIPRFEEGAVFINEFVKSDPRLPFGGVKESGYGRELSAQGIKEFVNIKTVYINK